MGGGAIIGKNGVVVKEIRQKSRAQVSIEPECFENNQLLKVISTPEGIKTAFEHISSYVQDEAGKDDFIHWARYTFFTSEEPRRDNRRRDGKGDGKGDWKGDYDHPHDRKKPK